MRALTHTHARIRVLTHRKNTVPDVINTAIKTYIFKITDYKKKTHDVRPQCSRLGIAFLYDLIPLQMILKRESQTELVMSTTLQITNSGCIIYSSKMRL